MTDITPHLVLTNVTKRFQDTTILDNLCLTLPGGNTLAIVGPSGSGKSSLLNIIGALDTPTSGTVTLGATDVTALTGKALATYRSRSVGFVFQEHHLLPQLTATENVLLPALAAKRIPDKHRANDLLAAVGVQQREHAFPSQLSGGERQRVAIARALMNEPGLLLCDEPTGNLDSHNGAKVVALLLELAREHSLSVIMVTHNMDHAAQFDRCVTLTNGRLMEE